MFAIPGLVLLIFVDFVRPQEFIPMLRAVPLLHLFTALAAIGFVVDLRLGLSERRAAPQLPWIVAFFLWNIISTAINAPQTLAERIMFLIVPISIGILIAQGVQTFRMLQVLAGALLAIAIFLAAVGTHQGLAPWGCHKMVSSRGQTQAVFDGRECFERVRDTCEDEAADPNADYVCEKVGLFGTSSLKGRVRYRGSLEDPNELSLVVGVAVPFCFMFLDRRRSLSRL